MMNARERFRACCHYESVDRTFLLPAWYWSSTWERWVAEGLPHDADPVACFRTDVLRGAPVAMQGRYGPHLVPGLERLVLAETDEHQVVRDEEGNTVRLLKRSPTESMPAWIEYPLRNRHDWETLVKPRLDPDAPGRYPQGPAFEEYVTSVQQRDEPLEVWCGSLYGWPRSLMGVQRLSLLFYDDPALVHEICEHIADFVIAVLHPWLDRIHFDCVHYWEDMAGVAGPLCSPATYREFMLAPLKRITDLLHAHGSDVIIVDSDGNNDALVPLWLEAGLTGLRPFEAAAGCDPVGARRRYGRSLVIEGGIDKRALAGSVDDIEREVLSKAPWLCLQGGYLPQVDHLVPPNVSLANYRHYAALLRSVAEDPARWLHEARRRGYWSD